ncbi:MAG: protein kinase domain-containing protein, partial [Povalibacter sp.]
MALTLDELLARLVNGTLTVEGAATELKIIIRDQPQQCSALIALVQRQVASGQLPHTTALTLLGAIEQIVTELSDPTAASDTRIVLEDEPTRTSRAQSLSETLARLQTVRAHTELMTRVATPVANETMRSAPATPSKLADHTLNRSAPAEPTYSSSASSNAVNSPESSESSRTLRQNAGIAPTASRTVADSAPTQAAYARTLKSPADNTQVISERLVRSLEDVDEPQRGTLKPGSIVKKRFVLETLIGKGGMGLVFAAIDRRKEEAQDTNARVALKVLNADFERHPQSFIALQREARKAQTLAHPNLVTVFDFDRDGETVFMTMELLKGRPLEALVREARGRGIAPAIVLPLIRGIAEGLAYAHRKG